MCFTSRTLFYFSFHFFAFTALALSYVSLLSCLGNYCRETTDRLVVVVVVVENGKINEWRCCFVLAASCTFEQFSAVGDGGGGSNSGGGGSEIGAD